MAGVVQGIGFRPTLYRLATEARLGGSVQNRSGTVRLTLEGAADDIEAFMASLSARLPRHARLDAVSPVKSGPLSVEKWRPVFRIVPSDACDEAEVAIPADLVMCENCALEIADPGDRRYGYPFTTCTDCGPRYTVISGMPYDRRRTTMSAFPLCAACSKEYGDPGNRRFHAETTACRDCGPQLFLEDNEGRCVPGDALRLARAGLAEGRIVAVRGIGGYLLAVDAFNREALARLRTRKNRPDKPFAVMATDMGTVRRYCLVTPEIEGLLNSPEAPIVILDLDMNGVHAFGLPIDLITPDTRTLGVMLPTSPLHALLAQPLRGDAVRGFDLLVMTSGNRGGEPICISNEEARERLRGIADLFLMHDREINLRNDDSLCTVQCGAPQVWRRSRGYAPQPIRSAQPLQRVVLAMGAELKNTIAVGYDHLIVASPHVGDLETPEALDGLRTVVRTLPAFLGRGPEAVAVDLHPDMHCTLLGREVAAARGLPVVEVQHHHAHAVACLAEHGMTCGLAVTFDGTGLGSDGNIWGAELLDVTETGFKRLGSFQGVPLPGGDAAVREPVRQLVGRWVDAGVNPGGEWLDRLGISEEQVNAWELQCRRGINAPITHAAGRLFDAFSVLLGFASETTTYEGQTAIRLEAAAGRSTGESLPEVPFSCLERDGMLWIDWTDAFVALSDFNRFAGAEEAWALAVHHAIARAVMTMIHYALSHSSNRTVALSGGVFMNLILTDLLVPQLEAEGLDVLLHRSTPPNDGCVAIGQAVVAGRG